MAKYGKDAPKLAELEEKARGKWAMKLFGILKELGAPSVAGTELMNPTAAKRRWGRGLRSSTLKAHVIQIQKIFALGSQVARYPLAPVSPGI